MKEVLASQSYETQFKDPCWQEIEKVCPDLSFDDKELLHNCLASFDDQNSFSEQRRASKELADRIVWDSFEGNENKLLLPLSMYAAKAETDYIECYNCYCTMQTAGLLVERETGDTLDLTSISPYLAEGLTREHGWENDDRSVRSKIFNLLSGCNLYLLTDEDQETVIRHLSQFIEKHKVSRKNTRDHCIADIASAIELIQKIEPDYFGDKDPNELAEEVIGTTSDTDWPDAEFDRYQDDYEDTYNPYNDDDSGSDNIGELMAQLHDLMNQTRSGEYNTFFNDKSKRKEIFEFSAAVAEYLIKENVPNLVIIDRSARPLYVGVIEYLRNKFPQQKRPNIYFMNPKGFKSREELSPSEINEIIEDCEYKDDAVESPELIRSKEEILKEFDEVYSRLLKEKDKPVLIFDTCLHSGDSLAPVKEIFEEKGFADIRIGAVNPAPMDSKVDTDFYITTKLPINHCYPFDKDRIIEKTFNHIYSQRNDDQFKRRTSIALREEIKKIMQEYLHLKERKAA